MILGSAATPPGLRIYAIGDVHGCDGLLASIHEQIAADLLRRPPADHRIIHIGDYVDRGPDSAAVVGRLARLSRDDSRVLCLKGNHEALILDFLGDPTRFGATFLLNGGAETLRSYGVNPDFAATSAQLSKALRGAMPAEHRAFLDGLAPSLRFGDYFFCHAGIRPGLPLAAQREDDLLWIREDFLRDRREYDAVIIHGHTPPDVPKVHPNRINIDTGAFYTGALTCLVLEGTGYSYL